MGLESPTFLPGYAILLVVFLAGCASLFKPKEGYRAISWHDYKHHFKLPYSDFCLQRVSIWSLRFIFYYASRNISVTIFILDSILITIIAAVRLQSHWTRDLNELSHRHNFECEDLTQSDSDIHAIITTAVNWNSQLAWCLIVYFGGRMLSATVFSGGGSLAIMGSLIFDSWLLCTTIWSSMLQQQWDNFVHSDEYSSCYEEIDGGDFDDPVDLRFYDLLFILNTFNALLLVMSALTLPFGIVMDVVFTSFREHRHMMDDPSTSYESFINQRTQQMEALAAVSVDVFHVDVDDIPKRPKSPNNEQDEITSVTTITHHE